MSRDPFNIGDSHGIYINPGGPKVLLVKSLKWGAKITEIMQHLGLTKREAVAEYKKQGFSVKPDKWGAPGGKIEYWANFLFQKKYEESAKSMSQVELAELLKREDVAEKIFEDEKVLNLAAKETLVREFQEETGLHVTKSKLLLRVNTTSEENPNQIYPKFWFLVEEATGELHQEPLKKNLSKPEWVLLQNLQPQYRYVNGSRIEKDTPFFPSHLVGLHVALNHYIENGFPHLKAVLEELEFKFRPHPRRPEKTDNNAEAQPGTNNNNPHSSDEDAWTNFTKGITPFKR